MGNYMKKILIFMLCFIALSSCKEKYTDVNHKVIYHGSKYDIVLDTKDSIYFLLPGINSEEGAKPVVVNKKCEILNEN